MLEMSFCVCHLFGVFLSFLIFKWAVSWRCAQTSVTYKCTSDWKQVCVCALAETIKHSSWQSGHYPSPPWRLGACGTQCTGGRVTTILKNSSFSHFEIHICWKLTLILQSTTFLSFWRSLAHGQGLHRVRIGHLPLPWRQLRHWLVAVRPHASRANETRWNTETIVHVMHTVAFNMHCPTEKKKCRYAQRLVSVLLLTTTFTLLVRPRSTTTSTEKSPNVHRLLSLPTWKLHPVPLTFTGSQLHHQCSLIRDLTTLLKFAVAALHCDWCIHFCSTSSAPLANLQAWPNLSWGCLLGLARLRLLSCPWCKSEDQSSNPGLSTEIESLYTLLWTKA